jgi:hypothetical protein
MKGAPAMDDRNRKRLEAMDPETRAKAEAALARLRSPEARAGRAAAMEAVEREVRETGGVVDGEGKLHKVRVPVRVEAEAVASAPELGSVLRAMRESSGISIDDFVRASGIERSAVFKLERGASENPTIRTLERYARALGRRLVIAFDPADLTEHRPRT